MSNKRVLFFLLLIAMPSWVLAQYDSSYGSYGSTSSLYDSGFDPFGSSGFNSDGYGYGFGSTSPYAMNELDRWDYLDSLAARDGLSSEASTDLLTFHQDSLVNELLNYTAEGKVLKVDVMVSLLTYAIQDPMIPRDNLQAGVSEIQTIVSRLLSGENLTPDDRAFMINNESRLRSISQSLDGLVNSNYQVLNLPSENLQATVNGIVQTDANGQQSQMIIYEDGVVMYQDSQGKWHSNTLEALTNEPESSEPGLDPNVFSKLTHYFAESNVAPTALIYKDGNMSFTDSSNQMRNVTFDMSNLGSSPGSATNNSAAAYYDAPFMGPPTSSAESQAVNQWSPYNQNVSYGVVSGTEAWNAALGADAISQVIQENTAVASQVAAGTSVAVSLFGQAAVESFIQQNPHEASQGAMALQAAASMGYSPAQIQSYMAANPDTWMYWQP